MTTRKSTIPANGHKDSNPFLTDEEQRQAISGLQLASFGLEEAAKFEKLVEDRRRNPNWQKEFKPAPTQPSNRELRKFLRGNERRRFDGAISKMDSAIRLMRGSSGLLSQYRELATKRMNQAGGAL